MTKFTLEQVAEAKQEGQLLVDIYGSAHGQIFFCTNDGKKHNIGAIIRIILAALEAAQKERDALATYVAKLEKVGDQIPERIAAFKTLRNAWDAVRKEKP